MYLKQIKIYGFKSFADKTEIDLSPNINGVVGPNGSGKSNIIDAVRWVLGEQSIKSLRGETSADIIFSGSKSRKPLNSAYVALIFDNTDKSLPIDYNEVSVKRVIYRTGEVEYYLNNERCRLKDINDLLTDSGASKESFNIISQGKIDEILSTKPADRRVIFESAAGVLKYKKRKEEAIKKLERTNTNIDRVNDIIRELENNLEPLKRQSEDAKKYLEWQEKLKEVEVSLITNDIENYTYKTKEDKITLDKLNDEIASLSSNNINSDIEILNSKQKLKDIDEKISTHQSELIEITRKIETIDADIRVLKERKKYTKTTNEIKNNILLLKEEELKINEQLNEIKNTLEINNKQKEQQTQNIDQYLDKMNTEKNQKNNLNIELNKNNNLLTDIKYKIQYLENSINTNSSMPKSIKNILNNPRFDFVHNTIGNLIETEDRYATCLETALSASSNYLVVNTSDNAKELVNYLKDNNLGRATFFPLDVIKSRYLDLDTLTKLSNIPSYINTLDKLVTYDKTYENIIKNQLGNVIVTENIQSANYISKLINHKYKIVTLDGQIVNVGGSVTGGSKLKINTPLKDKYDLDENKKKEETLINKNKNIIDKINIKEKEISKLEEIIYNYKIELKETEFNINKYNNLKENIQINLDKIKNELKDLNSISNLETDEEEEKLLAKYYNAKQQKDNINTTLDILKIDRETLNKNIEEIETINKKSNQYIQNKEKQVKELELKLNTMNIKIDNLLMNLNEEYNMTFEHAKERFKLEIDENFAREEVKRLKNNLKNIGIVNIAAIEEYEKVKSRYEFLINQKDDLKQAEETLLEIIKEMDDIMIERFTTTFEKIRHEFKIVFREMFKGGQAELKLTDPENILETGIEIEAIPSGKTMKSISLLSGGEKTFTAISLLFAILNIRPVPFCLLDEVEAALDDANVESFGNYLYKYRNTTQFLLITHKKKTMEFVNNLYGITMQESGVSKLVSVRLEDLENKK